MKAVKFVTSVFVLTFLMCMHQGCEQSISNEDGIASRMGKDSEWVQ